MTSTAMATMIKMMGGGALAAALASIGEGVVAVIVGAGVVGAGVGAGVVGEGVGAAVVAKFTEVPVTVGAVKSSAPRSAAAVERARERIVHGVIHDRA